MKKIKNKKYIIILIMLMLLTIPVIIGIKNLKKEKIEEPKNKANFAIMITNDKGDGYKEFRENITWPDINYKINLDKCDCVDIDGNKKENIVTFNHTNWEAEVETDETVYCTLYFDKANPDVEVTLKEEAGYDNLNLKATPKDIEGTITEYEFRIGKSASTLGEWQKGTVNGDRTGSIKFEGLEDGVEYYVSVKVTEIIGKQEKEIEVGPFIFKTRDREPEVVSIASVTNSTPWKAATVKTIGKKGTREISSYCYLIKEGNIATVEEAEWNTAECNSNNLSVDKLSHTKEIVGLKEKTKYTVFVKIKDINNLMSLNSGKVVITTQAIPTPTVTYDTQEGNACNPGSKTVWVDSTYGELCTPTRTGYTFIGWYNDAGGKIESWTPVTNIYNHTLHARWIANQYTITYIGNGNNSGAMGVTTCTYDSNCTLSANAFGKIGYSFGYWYGNNGVGYQNSQTFKYNIAGNLTLTAQWAANQYTITYIGNGNDSGAMGATTCTYGSNCTLQANVFGKTGYSFGYWFGSDWVNYQNSQTFNYNIAGNLTLYAQWYANTYIVTNNNNDGSGCGNYLVTFNNTYGSLCTPTRVGYTFAGWYDEYGRKVETWTPVTIAKNHTLTAAWVANNYTVSYNTAGGGGCSSKIVTFGGQYGDLCTPTRADHYFTGWYLNGALITSGSVVNIAGNHTLTAGWASMPIRVYFYTNGGSINSNGYTANSSGKILRNGGEWYGTVPYGENKDLADYNSSSNINIIKRGYIAKTNAQWNTAINGTGTSFNQATNYNYSTYKNYSINRGTYYELNLYVNWMQKPIYICFHPNGGTVSNANGFGTNSAGYVVDKNGKTYCKLIYEGESLGENGLPDYNNAGNLNITKKGKVVKPGEEWIKTDGTQILSQYENYTYNQLRQKVTLNDTEDNIGYFRLYLKVYWRDCKTWNYKTTGYDCNCYCVNNTSSKGGPYGGNYSTCSLVCASKGYADAHNGSCTPIKEKTTCKEYN